MKTTKNKVSAFLAFVLLSLPAIAATPPLASPLRGWQVWPSTGERILPSTPAPANATNARLRVVSARDCVASASFALRSSASFSSLTIEPSPLVATNGATLPPGLLDLRVVKCWYQDANGWFATTPCPGEPVLVPELLLHDDSLVRVEPKSLENLVRTSPAGAPPAYRRMKAQRGGSVLPAASFVAADDAERLLPFALAKDETRQVYLTIGIPPSARGGLYRGKLVVVGDGRPLGHLDLSLRIVDHLLPPASSRFSGGGSLDGSKVISGASPAPLTTVPEPFRAIATLPAGGHSPAAASFLSANGPLEPVLHREDLPRAKDFFGGKAPDCLWIAREGALAAEAKGIASLPEAVAVAKEALATGAKEIRLFLPARPGGEGLREDLAALEAVDDLGVFPWTFVTDESYCQGAAVIRSPMRRGYPPLPEKYGRRVHDSRSPDGSCYGEVEYSDTRPCERWHGVGAPFYLYSTLPVGIEDPSLWRRRLGLECFKLGYEGFVLDGLVESSDPWNDWAAADHRSRSFLYPTKSGYVPTLAWEGVREAITDVRYLSSLNRLAEAVRYAAMDNPRLDIEGRKASRWLEGLPNRKADLDMTRLDALAWIVRLEAFLGKYGK